MSAAILVAWCAFKMKYIDVQNSGVEWSKAVVIKNKHSVKLRENSCSCTNFTTFSSRA